MVLTTYFSSYKLKKPRYTTAKIPSESPEGGFMFEQYFMLGDCVGEGIV